MVSRTSVTLALLTVGIVNCRPRNTVESNSAVATVDVGDAIGEEN